MTPSPDSISAPGGSPPRPKRGEPPVPVLVGVLALALLLSGFCGILAELSLFNLAENLLGGTNRNLTYTMGFMMFAMGAGAGLTGLRWFRAVPIDLLIGVELAISVLAMISVVGIYTLTGHMPAAAPWLIWTFSPMLGLVIGLEIPLVLRINEALGVGLRPNAALVLAPDYLGALAAFVLFSFWLLPSFGLARAAWLGGVLNLGVGGLVLWMFRARLRHPVATGAAFVLVALLAGGLGWRLEAMMASAEQLHYRDGIVWSKASPYQRIVVTSRARAGNPDYERGDAASSRRVIARRGEVALVQVPPTHPSQCAEDIRLYINGGLQFSTCDEYRYHEMLVHPAWFLSGGTGTGKGTETGTGAGKGDGGAVPRALVLGGGDGLAVRELLKYDPIRVELVELDRVMVELFRDDPRFARLNGGALSDARVEIHIGDAVRFLHRARRRYRLIVLDFPDPHQTATARLYSRQLYLAAARVLAPGGIVITQSFSPLYHQPAFLVVRKTMAAAGLRVVSLQVPMLTFEHWGFHLGSRDQSKKAMEARLERFQTVAPTRYLNLAAVQAAFRWDKESFLGEDALPVNDQFTLPLLQIYNQGLRRQ